MYHGHTYELQLHALNDRFAFNFSADEMLVLPGTRRGGLIAKNKPRLNGKRELDEPESW